MGINRFNSEDLSLEDIQKEYERVQNRGGYRRAGKSIIYALIVIICIGILASAIMFPVLKMSGSSMEPTLSGGQYVMAVRSSSFDTGDVIAFDYGNRLLVRRVIATAGDMVNIDEEGNVYVNDILLDEPYVEHHFLGYTDLEYPYQVPANRLFVMGDERENAVDSRSGDFGVVPTEDVSGKILLRFWPLSELSLIK